MPIYPPRRGVNYVLLPGENHIGEGAEKVVHQIDLKLAQAQSWPNDEEEWGIGL